MFRISAYTLRFFFYLYVNEPTMNERIYQTISKIHLAAKLKDLEIFAEKGMDL